MAEYEIDWSKSVQASGDAFAPSTGGEHSSVVVDYGGYLLAGGSSDGMWLYDAFWDITVNGTVGNTSYVSGSGINLDYAGTGDHSNINIGLTGDVFGADFAIFSINPTNITNNGHVGEGNTRVGIMELGGGDVTILNFGTIYGSDAGIFIGSKPGTWNISNSGTIVCGAAGYAIVAHLGVQQVVNTGFIDGNVWLGDENDTFANQGAGHVDGIVDLGAGTDSFTGGDQSDDVRDGGGGDTVDLGDGTDDYIAVKATASVDGVDTVDGGNGVDLYSAEHSIAPVHINLSNGAFLLGMMAAHTATGQGIGTDHISGFEWADGGHGNDLIFGSNVANTVHGYAGNDTLTGLGGDDDLFGGDGSDKLCGGTGQDTLDGGALADTFIFAALAESVTGVHRDLIEDFSHAQGDTIDLHVIDANSQLSGNQSFHFIGAQAFHHIAGELRFGTNHVLSVDVEGDANADFQVYVSGGTLVAGDFVL